MLLLRGEIISGIGYFTSSLSQQLDKTTVNDMSNIVILIFIITYNDRTDYFYHLMHERKR